MTAPREPGFYWVRWRAVLAEDGAVANDTESWCLVEIDREGRLYETGIGDWVGTVSNVAEWGPRIEPPPAQASVWQPVTGPLVGVVVDGRVVLESPDVAAEREACAAILDELAKDQEGDGFVSMDDLERAPPGTLTLDDVEKSDLRYAAASALWHGAGAIRMRKPTR